MPPTYGNVRDFQRYYMDQAVPVDQYDANYQQWSDLFKSVFTKRAS